MPAFNYTILHIRQWGTGRQNAEICARFVGIVQEKKSLMFAYFLPLKHWISNVITKEGNHKHPRWMM